MHVPSRSPQASGPDGLQGSVQEDHAFQRSGDEDRGQDGEEGGDILNRLSRNATPRTAAS